MSREFEDAILSTGSSAHSEDEQQPQSPVCSTGDQCAYGAFKAIQGEGWSVNIRQTRKGFRCNAVIDAELPLAPDQAFDLLTDPEVKQWRQVKECTFRKVWEDDGNRQVVEVEQTVQVFFKTMRTRMMVTQDRTAGTMQFSLARRGALKVLKGQWTVTAHPTNPHCACIHLDQEMQPSFVPPPPFRRFMRKAMLGKAAQMLQQMREEATSILQQGEIRAKPAADQDLIEPIIERMASTKLTPQRSFDIVACAVAPNKVAPAPVLNHSPQHVASHCLSFDSASESEG